MFWTRLRTGDNWRRVRRYCDLILHVRQFGCEDGRLATDAPICPATRRASERPSIRAIFEDGPVRLGSRKVGHNPNQRQPKLWCFRGHVGWAACLYLRNGDTQARQAANRNPLWEPGI